MVGKGVEVKSSRIFHQCYVKCCKLQNLTPLNNLIPSANGKVLDFCVERIKYCDWPPILNALSCDLSLHSVSVRCRQQVKTVLEHIDCERLAKTVNKRAVILTNFMLSNLVEATSQLLSNTTLLNVLLLEGLPLKIPYLNPICEALLANSSLQHLFLPRSLIGDAGCQAVCKAVRCLPNILTLDLSGCEITPLGAGYIADLVKYQKIHRYSENWVHTLRYRPPELHAMAGLRRLSLCGNAALGDAGAAALLDALADDLWIKALDIQNCGLTEDCALAALQMLRSNTTIVVLDMRHNALVSSESMSKLRAALRENEGGMGAQYSWLSNISGISAEAKSVKLMPSKNGMTKDRGISNVRNASNKYPTKTGIVKKERDYAEILEEQLQEEISHRQQLEELNIQLVDQMKRLKQQQIQLWANGATSSGSEQSFQASSRSGDVSSSSGSTSSVPIDQNTLSYIQQAFKDIYAFIKNNQCNGECLHRESTGKDMDHPIDDIPEARSSEELEPSDLRINITAKKAQSTHIKLVENTKMKKITKSAHLLGDIQHNKCVETKLQMIERHMGDTKTVREREQNNFDEIISQTKSKKSSYDVGSTCESVSDSSDTLVSSPRSSRRAPPRRPPSPPSPPNPRDALVSSSDDD